jgi:4a-hydroxytetrahydrobiopterin dehydratase
MLELKERNCIPLLDGTDAMLKKEIDLFKKQLTTEWLIIDDMKLKKVFPFESYKRAMAFVQEVALIAEKENHHPDICIHYTSVEIVLKTNDIGGLSVNDFIMAAKIEDL